MIKSNYTFRNTQTWFQVSFLVHLISILVQVLCSISVFCTKVKILMEERNTLDSSRSVRPSLNSDLVSEASNNITHLNARDLTAATNKMQMKKRGNKGNAPKNPEHASDRTTLPSYLINNVANNKILTEVYHMLLITLAASICCSAFMVKRNLSIKTLEEHSRILLCFLDLGPVILMAIILPMSLHLRNPEIRKYIRSLFP